jgi:uncharacterized protein (TIGR03435 family)
MLRRLLEGRFSLKIHSETQQRPVYILTATKRDTKLKPGDKKATNIRSGAHSISIDRGNIANLTRISPGYRQKAVFCGITEFPNKQLTPTGGRPSL